MTFEELTPWDINLIKSNAVYTLVNTKINNRYQAISNSVLRCLYSKGFDVSKDPQAIETSFTYKMTPPFGTSPCEPSSDEIIKELFNFMTSTKVVLTKSASREVTWHQPHDSWYHRPVEYKKPWVF